MVAADVRRRISKRNTLPPRYLVGYGDCHIAEPCMKHIRSVLLVVLGLALGVPLGWCLRGRSVAAAEALLHNLLEIEKSKQQWTAETNSPTEKKP